MASLAQRAANEVVGSNAADVAMTKLAGGDYTDPELLLRAVTRALADAGYPLASPPPALAGLCRAVQKHIESAT